MADKKLTIDEAAGLIAIYCRMIAEAYPAIAKRHVTLLRLFAPNGLADLNAAIASGKVEAYRPLSAEGLKEVLEGPEGLEATKREIEAYWSLARDVWDMALKYIPEAAERVAVDWPLSLERMYNADGWDSTKQQLSILIVAAHRAAACAPDRSPTKPETMEPETKALAVLAKNPTWSNKQIAAAVGCHEKSLSRFKVFRSARRAAKAHRPKGRRSSDGTIEAFD